MSAPKRKLTLLEIVIVGSILITLPVFAGFMLSGPPTHIKLAMEFRGAPVLIEPWAEGDRMFAGTPFWVQVDLETGCQYLSSPVSMVPRIDADGNQICRPGELPTGAGAIKKRFRDPETACEWLVSDQYETAIAPRLLPNGRQLCASK